eukprot:9503336-Prorocentrum_lima.AAC.1
MAHRALEDARHILDQQDRILNLRHTYSGDPTQDIQTALRNLEKELAAVQAMIGSRDTLAA